jgi:uncharacterized protein
MSLQQTPQYLPRLVDAIKLSRQAAHMEGRVKLAELDRLADLMDGAGGDAEVKLQFGLDDHGRRTVSGEIAAVLPVLCQHCLQAMDFSVDIDLNVALTWSDDEARNLPSVLDPVMVANDEGEVDLYQLVEEELLLALPSRGKGPEIFGKIDEAAGNSEENNPFSSLAEVKEQLKKTP